MACVVLFVLSFDSVVIVVRRRCLFRAVIYTTITTDLSTTGSDMESVLRWRTCTQDRGGVKLKTVNYRPPPLRVVFLGSYPFFPDVALLWV